MKIIHENPYRIIGILSNATAREIQSRKNKITAFTNVGKQIDSDFDFPFFNSIQRTNSIIDKSFSDIEQNQNKVINSLFWFTNLNSIDNTAIQHLVTGNKEKAIEIWDKLTDEKEVTSKNFSAFNNIGTLYLLEESKEKIKKGISTKIKLIESGSFQEFVQTVADETFSFDKTKQIEILVDELLTQFKNKYPTSETIKLFSKCNGTTQKYLSKKFTEEPIHIIETQIEKCTKKRVKDKSNAYNYGTDLYNKSSSELKLLKSILGNTNLQYKMLADNIAKEILQCSVDYFNESQEQEKSNNYLEETMKLAKLAESIAVNDATKNKVKENISTLQEMKDQVLSEAITVLQSIKDLYLENERDIRNQIKQLEQSDYEIRSGRKTINRRAVEESIKNSIEWQKVNEMIVDLLSDNNLKKIKESNNDEQKRKFLDLANWLKENSLKNATITTIINKYKILPPKLPFKIISSEVTNTDNKPLYTKFIRYIGLNMNIKVIEEKSVTLYFKYIGPDGSVIRNSETSPVGYSRSEIQKITINKKSINISGWGNADKCTYKIGKHRIEVYLDEYMIHSKDFVVDLTPSEKLEIELKKAEDRLNEIKNFKYFQTQFDNLNSQMNKIKQWQFLRSQSDRESQINEKQEQINSLIKKSEDEKTAHLIKQQSTIKEIKSKIKKAEY
ncbi:hypothetical protein [Flavobacterium sp.]|uniref:hypothetical protein n=1 Tax=Flavobacterium sp. TaxID=239 RepID=UPI00286F4AF6|nr:hypothetical protein [Flavobacterium sp.]